LIDLLELYFHEDCPYVDETVELLQIEGKGSLRIISREKGVSACADELARYYRKEGLKVLKYFENGRQFESGNSILEAEGDLKLIFKVWRVSQTFLSIMCAIATSTALLVKEAKKENPNIVLAATRKTHPGTRVFETKAARAGGGKIHRYSLSDSIQISQNHLEITGQLEDLKALKKIEIEPRSREEAIKYAKIADIILLDHFSLMDVQEMGPALKKINSKLELAVAGIETEKIREYASFVDIIVISAPYYAKPLDFTTKIQRI